MYKDSDCYILAVVIAPRIKENPQYPNKTKSLHGGTWSGLLGVIHKAFCDVEPACPFTSCLAMFFTWPLA